MIARPERPQLRQRHQLRPRPQMNGPQLAAGRLDHAIAAARGCRSRSGSSKSPDRFRISQFISHRCTETRRSRSDIVSVTPCLCGKYSSLIAAQTQPPNRAFLIIRQIASITPSKHQADDQHGRHERTHAEQRLGPHPDRRPTTTTTAAAPGTETARNGITSSRRRTNCAMPISSPANGAEKERDQARLPAEKRADHHHQRDVAEAHRLAPQRGRADQPHGPHDAAAGHQADERRRAARPTRCSPNAPNADDRDGAGHQQQPQRRPGKFAPQPAGDQAQRERRPAPAAPDPRREREAPQPIAAESRSPATATAAAPPTPAARHAVRRPSPVPATAVFPSAQLPDRPPHSTIACPTTGGAGRSATCGNSDIGTSVASSKPQQRAGDRDLIRNDLLVDVDERRRQHPAQQQRVADELPDGAATSAEQRQRLAVDRESTPAGRLPTNTAPPAPRRSPAPTAAAATKTGAREPALRGLAPTSQ